MNTGKRLGLWLLMLLTVWGCAGVSEKYPSDEAKAYFAAANEANYAGMANLCPQHVDLSAYTAFMGVKYPPTAAVEVLSAPPSRSYQAFAVLQSPASQSSQAVSPTVLAQLTNEAKAIGADAIIICGPSAAKAEAVAIKYRLESPEAKPRH